MSLLRNLIRSNGVLLHHLKPNQGGGSQFLLLRQSPRLNQDKVVDAILRQPPTQGNVHAKLFGIGMFSTTINDVMSLFESCNLSAQDIEVQYNNLFLPVSMVLQLPSHSAYDNAVREIATEGRLYKIEKVEPGQWGVESYDGKAVCHVAAHYDVSRYISISESPWFDIKIIEVNGMAK
ncbi:hypothetical protein MKX01_038362 [Papaver californicum]|nr:hypothetical protein MKX01_038362 [Papaver californicum]